jgi:hypothetical protein
MPEFLISIAWRLTQNDFSPATSMILIVKTVADALQNLCMRKMLSHDLRSAEADLMRLSALLEHEEFSFTCYWSGAFQRMGMFFARIGEGCLKKM